MRQLLWGSLLGTVGLLAGFAIDEWHHLADAKQHHAKKGDDGMRADMESLTLNHHTFDSYGADNKNGAMAHVPVCAVWCSDGRLGPAREQTTTRLGTVDLVARPGAALLFVSEKTRESALDEIRTLHELHHFPEIHLVDHTYCGAYRLTYPEVAEGGLEKEIELHRQNLRAAARIINEDEQLGDVTVKCFLHHLDRDSMEEVPVE